VDSDDDLEALVSTLGSFNVLRDGRGKAIGLDSSHFKPMESYIGPKLEPIAKLPLLNTRHENFGERRIFVRSETTRNGDKSRPYMAVSEPRTSYYRENAADLLSKF
jgi:hypothetical protein